MLPNAIVILWDNEPVGLDSPSGGYPFKATDPGSVKYWQSRELAESYIAVMQRGSSYGFKNVRVVEIQFRIID